jgi:hypothetical protein
MEALAWLVINLAAVLGICRPWRPLPPKERP